jgi:hypothetical protein
MMFFRELIRDGKLYPHLRLVWSLQVELNIEWMETLRVSPQGILCSGL